MFFFFREFSLCFPMDDLGVSLSGQAATGTDPQQGAALARAMLEARHCWIFDDVFLNQFLHEIKSIPTFFF